MSMEHGVALVTIHSTLMGSLQSFWINISEVHHYSPPPPLNPTSFSTHHTTAEISVSRPSILLPSFTQISSFYWYYLRRLAHQIEAALTRADVESIEKQDIRRRYASKQAPRANCKNLTAARVMSGKPLMKLESEQKLKEWLQTEKVAHNAAKGRIDKAKAKEPTKRKAHTPHSSSEFCLPLIGV